MNNGLLESVLQLSGDCHVISGSGHVTCSDDELPIGEDTHINIVLLLAKVGEFIDKDTELKERNQSECKQFVMERLREGQVERGLSALAILLQVSIDIASQIFSEEVVMEKAVEMANSEQILKYFLWLPQTRRAVREFFKMLYHLSNISTLPAVMRSKCVLLLVSAGLDI